MQSLAIERKAGKNSDLRTNMKDLAFTFVNKKVFEESFLLHTETTPNKKSGSRIKV